MILIHYRATKAQASLCEWDFGAYRIVEQRSFRRACANGILVVIALSSNEVSGGPVQMGFWYLSHSWPEIKTKANNLSYTLSTRFNVGQRRLRRVCVYAQTRLRLHCSITCAISDQNRMCDKYPNIVCWLIS